MNHLPKQKNTFFFRTIKFLFIFSGVLCMFWSCRHQNKYDDKQAHPQQGTMQIRVDESFEPVISQQIMVFETSFPKAHIQVKYEPESDCFKDFQNDSVSMIIVARGLKEDESNYYKSTLGHVPRYSLIAFDAVAVVVNTEAQDSIFSLKQIYNLLTDEKSDDKQVLLDGQNATSTVRYLMDSITKGKSFGVNVHGVNGSKAVLDAVAANKNAIGFVGLSWIGNNDDPEQAAYSSKLRLAYVESKQASDKDTAVYAKPSQATIYNVQYPFYRTIYCISKDDYVGLSTSFYNFMMFERGQLIFRRANLVPGQMNFSKRIINNDTSHLLK